MSIDQFPTIVIVDSKKDRRTFYAEYMVSDHWRGLRSALLRTRGRKCEACDFKGFDRPIDGHHLIYRDPLECGQVDDLMLLCRRCHDLVHEKMNQFPADTPVRSRFKRTRRFLREILGLNVPRIRLPTLVPPKPPAQPAPTPPLPPVPRAEVFGPYLTKKQRNRLRKQSPRRQIILSDLAVKRKSHQGLLKNSREHSRLARELAFMANVPQNVFDNQSLESLRRQMELRRKAARRPC